MMREMLRPSADQIIQRTSTLLELKKYSIKFDWIHEFSLDQLTDCCTRLDQFFPETNSYSENVQRELIQNPAFAAYYKALTQLFPTDPPVEKAPEPVKSRYGQVPYRSHSPQPEPPSVKIKTRLDRILQACRANGRDVTAYPERNLMAVLEQDGLDGAGQLNYLENFAPMELPEEQRSAAVESLCICKELPLDLSKAQRDLLLEPYVSTRALFSSAPFGDIWALLESCPALRDILQLLHQNDIADELGLKDYEGFSSQAQECCDLLASIIKQLGKQAADLFMESWKRNGCMMQELRRMERQIAADPAQDWESVLTNHSGYVNLLYGVWYKALDLSAVRGFQENILIYAITHKKKHFIRLIDKCADVFLSLPHNSLLFQEELYERHFNLNELTEKTLEDFKWMAADQLDMDALSPERLYTFPELKLLYGASDKYVAFFHMLSSKNHDYRLLVLRELLNHKVLEQMDDGDIRALADKLDIKPLCRWRQEEFRHIEELDIGLSAQVLAHLDQLQRLLPECRNQTDTMLALRHTDDLWQFASLNLLKNHITEVDRDWQFLVETMGLSEEFLSSYQDGILQFLCKNGAYIAKTYLAGLKPPQSEAFLRVVKAELMGGLNTLKYFRGDLEIELGRPLGNCAQMAWEANLCTAEGGVEVREYDDFFSTMLLGVQPKKTCLAYDSGEYRTCLLSSFDSNKKILYAVQNGKIIGRAFLRLTKGRTSQVNADKQAFTFVDIENIGASRQREVSDDEHVTVFLECPYISNADPETERKVKKLFISLAEKKAELLASMLVLSLEYGYVDPKGFTRTSYYIYISKSKAGAQYLDSLKGEATVSAEGSYEASTFLVKVT